MKVYWLQALCTLDLSLHNLVSQYHKAFQPKCTKTHASAVHKKMAQTWAVIGFQAIDRLYNKSKKSFVGYKKLLYLSHYKFSKKSL